MSPSAGGVTDAMPVNGGDEALLRGLLHSLRARWPATTLTVLCHRAEDSRRILSDLHIESALECHDTTGKIGFVHSRLSPLDESHPISSPVKPESVIV